jgi:hypothetical protein
MRLYKVRVKGTKKWETVKARNRSEAALLHAFPEARRARDVLEHILDRSKDVSKDQGWYQDRVVKKTKGVLR